jgi:dCMP deaminase
MNDKHLAYFMALAKATAGLSNCPRAKFGTVLVDTRHWTVVATAYNGTLRGSSPTCGARYNCECVRTTRGIASGTEVQIGCIHSEMNAICNAARQGVSTLDLWAFVNGEPCLMCAKLLWQAGIHTLFVVGGGYSTTEGVELLRSLGMTVHVV